MTLYTLKGGFQERWRPRQNFPPPLIILTLASLHIYYMKQLTCKICLSTVTTRGRSLQPLYTALTVHTESPHSHVCPCYGLCYGRNNPSRACYSHHFLTIFFLEALILYEEIISQAIYIFLY